MKSVRWLERAGQAALVVALAWFALRLRDRPAAQATPGDAVNAWYEAAARGDDRAYVGLLGGPLRASVESARRQQGPEPFRRSLRDSVAGLRGLAVGAAAEAPGGGTLVEVELVFQDRNERQRLELLPAGGSWAIVSATAATGVRPPVAYGTPVSEEVAATPATPRTGAPPLAP